MSVRLTLLVTTALLGFGQAAPARSLAAAVQQDPQRPRQQQPKPREREQPREASHPRQDPPPRAEPRHPPAERPAPRSTGEPELRRRKP